MVDYRSHRIDVLWVRWYQYVEESAGWDTATVDRVCFPPMADEHAFGFVNPGDVLRGCHMIPQFSRGLQYPDGTGISRCAQDASDWHFYYVNRFVLLLSNEPLAILMVSSFVDRDMVMRYHWGLGVGHTYAYGHGVDNETNDGDERDPAANNRNKDIHHTFPDASDSDENVRMKSTRSGTSRMMGGLTLKVESRWMMALRTTTSWIIKISLECSATPRS